MLWVIICYTLMFWVIDLRLYVVINLVSLADGIANCIHLIYDLFRLDKTSNQGQGSGYLTYLDDILIYSGT